MINNFQAAMMKLTTLGNTVSQLTDCSDVIPVPPSAKITAMLPPGKSMADVRTAVRILFQ